MNYTYLSETVGIKTVSEDSKKGVFEIEGLYAGYGLTIGNALRRALLSSLPGVAITYVKIKNAPHEFSTLPGVKEDIVDLTLNFKKVRLKMHTDETQVLTLKVKGEKEVTAGDIKTSSDVEIVNPEEYIASLTAKDAELDVEITVEKGLGYSSVESRKEKKLTVGLIGIDAFFSPVRKVNYEVENMRVGERTDYNLIRLEIETDGTVSPSSALHKTANILNDHFQKVSAVEVKEFEATGAKVKHAKKESEEEPKKKSKAKKGE
ncbi:MAG TPA: DNA-directed RNA polymerase subunit alpha [Candidatus Paceibacterota bacterium]|nr:DNA-directed RNA polymerase subunit alpha [Candidatus Paceibacterota bacterium]